MSNDFRDTTERMERIVRRLWDAAAQIGITTEKELAARARVDRSYVNNILNGKRRLTDPMLARLAFAAGTTSEALVGHSDCVGEAVPTYHTGAGDTWLVAEEAEPDETALPDPAHLIAFRVHGDSMDPLVRDGQTVFALRDEAPGDGDLAYIELEDGTATFKRVHVRERTGDWLLAAVNTAYPPQAVARKDVRRAMKAWGIQL